MTPEEISDFSGRGLQWDWQWAARMGFSLQVKQQAIGKKVGRKEILG
jgi:hypothetical protein